MALAGEVARELSSIRSWSNKNYDLKLAEKARTREEQVWEANVSDTPVDMTGPASKRYFSLPVSSHESANTHGRISSVPSRSGGRDRLVLPSLL
jgi:hypothetical protein